MSARAISNSSAPQKHRVLITSSARASKIMDDNRKALLSAVDNRSNLLLTTGRFDDFPLRMRPV
jgi:hypothetical protein